MSRESFEAQPSNYPTRGKSVMSREAITFFKALKPAAKIKKRPEQEAAVPVCPDTQPQHHQKKHRAEKMLEGNNPIDQRIENILSQIARIERECILTNEQFGQFLKAFTANHDDFSRLMILFEHKACFKKIMDHRDNLAFAESELKLVLGDLMRDKAQKARSEYIIMLKNILKTLGQTDIRLLSLLIDVRQWIDKISGLYQSNEAFQIQVTNHDSRYQDSTQPLLSLLTPFINKQKDALRQSLADVVSVNRRLVL